MILLLVNDYYIFLIIYTSIFSLQVTKMKIGNLLILTIVLPIFLGSMVIMLSSVIPINLAPDGWNNSTQIFVSEASVTTSQTQISYLATYISTFFNQTDNDIKVISSFINSKLNIKTNYDTYFGVGSIDNRTPPYDAYSYPFFSSTYINNISSASNLTSLSNYSYMDSSIYDDVFRAVYKSSNLYTGVYFGFQENGFYRYYPYVSFNSYPSFTYTCYYNNETTTGYDPRCRIWYSIAENDDNIHLTTPYVDALTGNILITSSKRVMNGSTLIGVIGMDYSMNKINDIITNDTYLIDSTGLLVSYPTGSSIYNVENTISSTVWDTILSSYTITSNVMNVTKNNVPHVLIYQYIPEQKYYLVMMYPHSNDITKANIIFSNVNTIVKTGMITVVVLLGVSLICVLMAVILLSRKYAKTIIQLSRDIEAIGKPNLQVELQERAPVSAEFTNVNKNFGNLLIAVKFGNDAYYDGDLNKAMELYNKAEELMKIMKNARGLSICYNNKANVYTQFGNITEGERLYLESIRIIQELLNKETDRDTILAYKVMLSYRNMNLGVLYKDSGKFDLAHDILHISLKYAREADNGIGISKISGNLGQLYLQQNNIRKATEVIYDMYNIVKDNSKYDDITLQYALMNLGLLEMYNKNYLKAGTYFNKVLYEHQQLDVYIKQVSIDCMYKILLETGNVEQANAIKSHTSKLLEQQLQKVSNNVLFVLDCSGSMAGARIAQCKSSITDIVTNYLTENDIISLFVFNENIHEIFRNNTKQQLDTIIKSINRIAANGGTAFYDALMQVIHKNYELSNNNESRWIVALTDGEDTNSKQNYNDVIDLLKQKPTNLIIITVGELPTRDKIQKICNSINSNTKSVGKIGKLVEIANGRADIEIVFKKVIQVITGQLHVDSL